MRTFRTLFSGGELFGVGACQAGWTHVDGFELDPRVSAIARLNGFNVHTANVCDVDYESLPPANHLHCSPSCKTASSANKAQGETEGDKEVAHAVARAIRAHQGRSFSLENVWFYRTYESFAIICAALTAADFRFQYDRINMADFGVPQTRSRLILRAVRRSWRARVPSLRPTHGRRGGILLERWRGWFASVSDILDTLPPTAPAPWQAARIPKNLQGSALFHSGRSMDRSGNVYDQNWREPHEPAYTLSTMTGGWYKAFIVGGGNTQMNQIESIARSDEEPMFTVCASDGAKKVARAFILSDQNANGGQSLTVRGATEPVWTVTGGASPGHYKASLEGRWVAMTAQALGRYQTVPDDYVGLTPEINGNGVPPLFARRMMETFV